jgi:uncharacterized phage-associated protein
MQFRINYEKSIEASLYIINKLGGCDIHQLFKILYFAEKSHLATYGRPITSDKFIAMKDGPVPSYLYDVMKFVRGDAPYSKLDIDAHSLFAMSGQYTVTSKREANLEYLSETDIEEINHSIESYSHYNYEQRVIASHDSAWDKANRNDDMNVIDIAIAAGAPQEMVNYIVSNIQNQQTFQCRS